MGGGGCEDGEGSAGGFDGAGDEEYYDCNGCTARRTETSLTTIGATTTAESLGSILPGTPLDRPVRDRPQPCQSGLWIGGGVRDPDVANWHLNPYYHCTYGDGEVGRFSSPSQFAKIVLSVVVVGV